MNLPNGENQSGDHQQYRENLRRVVSKQLESKHGKPSDIEKLMQKALDVKNQLQEQIRPILKAGGGFDKPALRDMVFTLYLQAFGNRQLFDREELEHLCTILYSELMMESIDADPTGSGTPDLLSGQ